MARPRKVNKPPTTTVVVSVGIRDTLEAMKRDRKESMDDLFGRLIPELIDLRQTSEITEDWIKKSSKKNEEYINENESLKSYLAHIDQLLSVRSCYSNVYIY
jgi:hypothetical protein